MIFEGALKQVERAIVSVIEHVVNKFSKSHAQLPSRVALPDLKPAMTVALEKRFQLPLCECGPLINDPLNDHRTAPALIAVQELLFSDIVHVHSLNGVSEARVLAPQDPIADLTLLGIVAIFLPIF
jgi:hypothetical protein